MSGNKSYDKGYRFEDRIRKIFSPYGEVKRADRSGAYTGEADLTWFWDLRWWSMCCKWGKGWEGKRHRARLEKADICIDAPARKDPIAILYVHKLLEIMGCKVDASAGLTVEQLVEIAKAHLNGTEK